MILITESGANVLKLRNENTVPCLSSHVLLSFGFVNLIMLTLVNPKFMLISGNMS